MTEVALIRHYPTDWNRERRLPGRTDRPLDAEARAALAGLRLPPPWDGRAILASPLARAVDTARALADGRAVGTDARLAEIAYGDWEGRLVAEMTADPSSGFVPADRLGWSARPPGGGESAAEAWDRVLPLLAEIAARGEPTLLVLHKALMRVILRMAAGGPGAQAPEIKRGRLYPLRLDARGHPAPDGAPVRLEPRS
ncbi:MAG TPA: histidine phosphatase family protein [Thermohalobaculum sp.]|nr:histidine phosphatase family protein [Thermohalobaculum sp.]